MSRNVLLITLALVLALLALPMLVEAQTPTATATGTATATATPTMTATPVTWTCSWNFADRGTIPPGWTLTYGTQGTWPYEPTVISGSSWGIWLTGPAGTTLTYAKAYFHNNTWPNFYNMQWSGPLIPSGNASGPGYQAPSGTGTAAGPFTFKLENQSATNQTRFTQLDMQGYGTNPCDVPTPTPTPLPTGVPPTVDITCPTEDIWAQTTASFSATTTGDVYGWEWDFGDDSTSTVPTAVGHVYAAPDTYTVSVEVTGPGGTGTDNCTLQIRRVGDPGSGGGGALYRPLATTDTDTTFDWDGTSPGLFSAAAAWQADTMTLDDLSMYTYNGPEPHTVIGLSTAPGKPVYAVADGTVLNVRLARYVGNEPCEALDDARSHYGSTFDECRFGLYTWSLIGMLDNFTEFFVDATQIYQVTVSFGDNEVLRYFVKDAPLYVTEGQQLQAGCIVGLTSETKFSDDTPLTFGAYPASQGIFWMARYTSGAISPILPQLYIEPDPETACNASGASSDCLFDPNFTNAAPYQWTLQGDVVSLPGGGFELDPYESVTLSGLNLSGTKAYSFAVWAEYNEMYYNAGGTSRAQLELSIGTTDNTFILQRPDLQRYGLQLALHDADEGTLYSISVLNTGSVPVRVRKNCVTDSDNAPTPAACYFTDNEFISGAGEWSTTGTWVSGGGYVRAATDLATIGQNVRLYGDTNGGHAYPVTIYGMLMATDDDTTVTLNHRLGSGAWEEIDSFTYGEQTAQLGPTVRMLQIKTTITTTNFEGLYQLQVDFTPDGTDVIGSSVYFTIDSICIDDQFSHHPGGTGNDYLPGTPGSCKANPPPQGSLQDDVGAWISYHLDGMTDIYYCEVIPQLEQLNNSVYSIYEYAQWTGLYSQAAQEQTFRWLNNSMFPWLGGHLSNIALAAGGRIAGDVGGGCHDLFCVLTALIDRLLGPIVDLVSQLVSFITGLITTAIDLLLPLLEAVVGFFVVLITGLGSVLESLVTMVTAFITGVTNAQPAPVPGLPNCAVNPNESAICAVLYGLEHTVFAEEGAAIIPLFIAILSIVQLQWLISKLSELIQDVADRI